MCPHDYENADYCPKCNPEQRAPTKDDLVLMVYSALCEMKTDEERHAFLLKIAEGFCRECGADTSEGPCYCTRDE